MFLEDPDLMQGARVYENVPPGRSWLPAIGGRAMNH